MKSNNRVQMAGLIGMAGAVVWIISLVLEYSLGLEPPGGSGPLYVINQILALVGLAGIGVGIVGIRWGGGVAGRFGLFAVWMFALGYTLIIVGGIMALFTGSDDSPLFVLFPIGGLMMDVGALLTGVAVIVAKGWSGWPRVMPMIYAAYLWLAISIPFAMGFFPDGPGFVPETFQGIGLFMVALAVYTAPRQRHRLQPTAAG
jgi:hypothetical protein